MSFSSCWSAPMKSAPRYRVQRLVGKFQTALERRASLSQIANEMKNVSQSNVGQCVVFVVTQRLPVLLSGLVKQRQPLSVDAFSH